MSKNACSTSSTSKGAVRAALTLAFALAGCGGTPASTPGSSTASVGASAPAANEAAPAANQAPPAGDDSAPTTPAAPGELLTGTWSYVPAASCGASQYGTVNGNTISVSSGGYCSAGNGVPFNGFSYEQPVAVEAGGSYDLTLTLSSFNGWLGFIPTQFTVTVAGVTRTASASSASTIHLTFPIDTLPSGPATIRFTVRPPAGGVGPVNGGIFIVEEGCTSNLSLVRTN